jgi:hypothetical protein
MKQLPAIAQTFILTSFSALSLFAISPAQAASFMGLGSLPDFNVFPTGISADGSVVVGYNYSLNQYKSEALRWTQKGGLIGLGFLPGGNDSRVNGVSVDGSVIVGSSMGEAFRWTQAEGMVGLGTLPSSRYSSASGVSADGSIVVGSSGGKVFRWTQAEGMVSLGFSGNASGVSADGSVVVVGGSGGGIFRWTQAEGIVSSLDDPAGGDGSYATGMSADGSVVIGTTNLVIEGTPHFRGKEAVSWIQGTHGGGIRVVRLGHLNPYTELGYVDSQAYGVSADGSVIVGSSEGGAFPVGSSSSEGAFRWTQERGMVNIKDQLTGFGLNLSGWRLYTATGVSADGFTIVGYGTNPSGQTEGWVANLSPEPIPEPLTILGSIAAIGFAAGFERKFNKNKSDEKDPEA